MILKKLVVYPYHDELSPFLRLQSVVSGFEKIIPVSPRGFGFADRDAGICDGGLPTGVTVLSELKAALSQCDSVFFDRAINSSLDYNHYLSMIQTALDMGKEVIITKSLLMTLPQSSIDLSKIRVIGYSLESPPEIRHKKLFDIPIPCVTVLGTGDKSNKFEVQIAIADYFKSHGYNTCLLGTKEYTEMFGFEPLPEFLFIESNQRDKILKFNHYIYQKVINGNYDIIIIGCPGGIMPDNPFIFLDYGELPIVIGTALQADTSVLCTYAAPLNEIAVTFLQNLCKYKLNAEVRRISLACKDMTIDQATMELKYITLDSQFVKHKIMPTPAPNNCELYIGLLPEDENRLAKSIETELLNNVGG